ncbi:MAG: GNAT family N-acetyltransferase [Albidovulum sp.]
MLPLWSRSLRQRPAPSPKDAGAEGMAGTAPELLTDRLRLRMPRLADFEHRAAFYASPRAVHEDGPVGRVMAWRIWASEVGQWPLLGYGPFSVEDRRSGAYLGEVGIYHPVGFPEPELGWFVLPEAEGKGYAAEAARAVMLWAHRTFSWDHLINIIAPGNDRSIALARRLGGVHSNRPGVDPGDVVILHDLRALA